MPYCLVMHGITRQWYLQLNMTDNDKTTRILTKLQHKYTCLPERPYAALYSWWWVELSPETCRVKLLRRINAIVASCWNYFTINMTPCSLVHVWNIRGSRGPLEFGRGYMRKIPPNLQRLTTKLYGFTSHRLKKNCQSYYGLSPNINATDNHRKCVISGFGCM